MKLVSPRFRAAAGAILALASSTLPCGANVSLPALISEHAVLQKAARVPIYGKGAPGEVVTVTLGGVEGHTQAGADGRWSVNLDLRAVGAGPFTLKVSGQNELAVPDVLVGEVWVCSGQSNMEFALKNSADAAAEIAGSANPQLREFTVKKHPSLDPLDDCEGQWVISDPTTAGGFSAVAYYFGKELQHQHKAPVGLIHSSWGGTFIEAWMGPDAFTDPEMKAAEEKYLAGAKAYPALAKEFAVKFREWATRLNRLDHPADPKPFAAPDAPADGWKPVTVPGELAKEGLPDAGAIWLRTKVQVPPGDANVQRALFLSVNDFDTIYWNGTKVGETAYDHSTAMNTTGPGLKVRRYNVPANVITAGENTLAIRLFVPLNHAGIAADNHPPAAPPLVFGPWMAKVEFALPALGSVAGFPALPPVPVEPHLTATELYNGMVHPLLRYAMRGVVWYQGEQNAGRGAQYRSALLGMIGDWRAKWGEGDFPFLVCQLPNFQARKPAPGESAWAEIRESEAKALSLPNTGLAVLIDLGEEGDVHPKDKKDVGNRVAQVALGRVYGQPVVTSGPTYRAMTAEGDKIRLAFDAPDGLVARPLPATYKKTFTAPPTPLVKPSPGSELQGFAICGADHKWQWAQARIEGAAVVVSTPEVPAPVAVRYAWADTPTCNLYGKSGLPAVPFRTDDFPLSTAGAKY